MFDSPRTAGRKENMKTRVFDPFSAVRESGGCTFEPEIGWWTQVQSSNTAEKLGVPFAGQRDAIYIPTIQKSGEPVAEATVLALKERAQNIGMTNIIRATGMWVLSTTGEVQSETIWIAYGNQATSQENLAKLASDIQSEANQDCVAFEQSGVLNFTATCTVA